MNGVPPPAAARAVIARVANLMVFSFFLWVGRMASSPSAYFIKIRYCFAVVMPVGSKANICPPLPLRT